MAPPPLHKVEQIWGVNSVIGVSDVMGSMQENDII